MAKKREAPVSVAARLVKSLPKLTPLLRDAHAALWTDAQCEAWGRAAEPNVVLAQANDWLKLTAAALAGDDADDVPYSKPRLAALAELTVALERALAGELPRALAQAQEDRDARFDEARRLAARVVGRLTLLVGGDEARAAALAIAHRGHQTVEQLLSTLPALAALLSTWRKEPRLVVLADALDLDLEFLKHVARAHDALEAAVLQVTSEAEQRPQTQPVTRLTGRVLRELAALHRAFEGAAAAGLRVPKLKVRPGVEFA